MDMKKINHSKQLNSLNVFYELHFHSSDLSKIFAVICQKLKLSICSPWIEEGSYLPRFVLVVYEARRSLIPSFKMFVNIASPVTCGSRSPSLGLSRFSIDLSWKIVTKIEVLEE
jgi:hypothetical protein